tara:strand:- start:272 stop:445 length:174 start_codon:yes stop_codon:yes gene_type:complete
MKLITPVALKTAAQEGNNESIVERECSDKKPAFPRMHLVLFGGLNLAWIELGLDWVI